MKCFSRKYFVTYGIYVQLALPWQNIPNAIIRVGTSSSYPFLFIPITWEYTKADTPCEYYT